MSLFQRIRFWIFLLIVISAHVPAWAAPITKGDGKYTVNLPELPLDIFTYKPDCPIKGMLLVFHGVTHNAEGYRNVARSLGDRLCMIVVAPLFDEKRFPGWRYQMGGIVYQHKLQPPNDWTGQLVLELVAWIRQQEGQDLPYSLIGHSAGGQFLSRFAAFTPNKATRIVIGNPSTYVFASLQIKAPFGLGGVYSREAAESQLKRYLQTPVTIFIGQEDIGDKELNNKPAALAQGKTRYDRGLNAFHTAQALAQSHGWTFNWRLVEVPKVGHDTIKMFSSDQAVEALSP